MSKSVLVTPMWDEIQGEYVVAEATMKGLGEVHGETRAAFQENLEEILGQVDEAIIVYAPDDRVILRHDLH